MAGERSEQWWLSVTQRHLKDPTKPSRKKTWQVGLGADKRKLAAIGSHGCDCINGLRKELDKFETLGQKMSTLKDKARVYPPVSPIQQLWELRELSRECIAESNQAKVLYLPGFSHCQCWRHGVMLGAPSTVVFMFLFWQKFCYKKIWKKTFSYQKKWEFLNNILIIFQCFNTVKNKKPSITLSKFYYSLRTILINLDQSSSL